MRKLGHREVKSLTKVAQQMTEVGFESQRPGSELRPPATAFCYKSSPIFLPPEENIIIKRSVGHTPRTAMLQYSGLLKVVERMLLLSRILHSMLGKLHCPRVEERELCFTHFSPLVTDGGRCHFTNFPQDHTKISLYSVLPSSYTVSRLIAVKLWKNRLYCLFLLIHSLFTPHPGFCPIRSLAADLSEVTENLQSANSTSPQTLPLASISLLWVSWYLSAFLP